jgi:alkylhydroperoxidase family enzyme
VRCATTRIRAAELGELHKFYNEGQIIELTLVICEVNFTSHFIDALKNVCKIFC